MCILFHKAHSNRTCLWDNRRKTMIKTNVLNPHVAYDIAVKYNDVARTMKKYAHQRETTGSRSDFPQSRPFLK